MEEKKQDIYTPTLHQEIVKKAAVKFTWTIGFSLNKRRRITSTIKFDQLLQVLRKRLETEVRWKPHRDNKLIFNLHKTYVLC